MNRAGRAIHVRGTVQGVGFRPWVARLAKELQLGGTVRNDSAGVTIEAFGEEGALERLLYELQRVPAPAAVSALEWRPLEPAEIDRFRIVASAHAADPRVSIPPDLATCDACVKEIFDPTDRRHRYPFTNCTRCGPRFTVAKDIPYDRPATTMAPFVMCPECQREYDDPEDRRYHAQPNACPACGPRLWLVDARGRSAGNDPITAAARAIAAQGIVALKGLGGYHLACDATSPKAVRRLRARKHRDEKPFAVMVRDLEAAERVASLSARERQLLASPERPIVLCVRRPDSGIADDVAPGSPRVGLMLAYTPLHHLLCADAGRPLVMTSGNASDEPIAYRDDDAWRRLAAIADLMLAHDREIDARCDDSVARVVGGKPVLLRRSRGYVPRAVKLATPLARPVLACGAHLKNVFALGAGDAAILGPHVGDLDHLEVVRAYEESIARLERFTKIRPEVIAHDLHPEYLSTQYAEGRPETTKIAVQHHHAHAVSVMAEHGLAGPAIAVVYDGTGWGTDGTAWGGEILLAERASFRRIATFRPIRLAGADLAVKQPWRTALALLLDAMGDDAPLARLPLFAEVPPKELEIVRGMIARAVNAPLARGVGRYFDAVGALALARPRASFEGQLAMALDDAADSDQRAAYPYDLEHSCEPWTIDLRPLVRAACLDVVDGRAPGSIAARFHETIVRATAETVRRAALDFGELPVVLSGGCFANARLSEGIERALAPELRVFRNEQVPPGDGGIALGQLVVADAIARGDGRCA